MRQVALETCQDKASLNVDEFFDLLGDVRGVLIASVKIHYKRQEYDANDTSFLVMSSGMG